MSGQWYEFRGREDGQGDLILLMKIPAVQVPLESDRETVRREMEQQGTTDIEIRLVDEDPPMQNNIRRA